MKHKELRLKPGGCIWCGEMIFAYESTAHLEDELRWHVLRNCKKHPMRKLERKIQRLEKRERKK